MKKTCFIIATILMVIILGSCDSRNKLTASTAKRLITDYLLEKGQTVVPVSIKLGYYEENDEDKRYELRQLAANKLITYQAERIEWQERYVKDWYYESYWNMKKKYVYATRTNKSVFVTVELTPQGEKYLYSGPEPYNKPKDKYENIYERSSFPEDTVSAKELFLGDIKTEQEKPKEKEAASSTSSSLSEKSSTKINEKEKSEYQLAKEKESSREKAFIGLKIKVADVRRIRVNDGKASCEVILKCYDTSPFGRIVGDFWDHYHTGEKGYFLYYQDLGWVREEEI